MSDTVEHSTALSADERAELARLRAEVLTLRAAPRRRRFSWKSAGAAVLITIGCLLAPLSLMTVWVHNQVSNTDRFVATASPLIQEPSVQAAVTDRVTDTIFGYVDVQAVATEGVQALAAQGVPPRVTDTLQGLTGPLASSVQNFVHDRVAGIVASPAMAQLWDQTIRTAHAQMNEVLSGDSQAVVVSGGEVRLDLGPFVQAAKQQLVAAGFGVAARVPDVHPTIPITDATTLERAQNAYSLLDKVATWLPWVMLVLLALGIYLARRHRRALIAAALGVAAGMIVIAGALLIVRGILVGAVPPRASIATSDTYDTFVRFLRLGLRTVFAVAVVVALGAFLAGPSVTAVAIRRGTVNGIGWLRRAAPQSGPVGAWVYAHRTVLRVALVAIAVLVFLFLSQPSGIAVLVIALVLLFCLAVVQFLARPPGEAASAGGGRLADGHGPAKGD